MITKNPIDKKLIHKNYVKLYSLDGAIHAPGITSYDTSQKPPESSQLSGRFLYAYFYYFTKSICYLYTQKAFRIIATNPKRLLVESSYQYDLNKGFYHFLS